MSSMAPMRDGGIPPNRPGRGGATLADLWRSPATSQKLLALALLAASLAVGGYGVSLVIRGSERVLYRDLPEREAALAVQRLGAAGIDARLGDDGHSLWVRSGRLDDARLLLAGDGLPTAGTSGYEIFDQTNFGMTDFLEQVNYQRALEGELARTIGALDEVSQARVHLVLPRESIYSSETARTKASVSLRLRKALEPRSVKAVVNLVASAVSGLEPENVVVVDSNGRTLHAGGDSPPGEAMSEDQLVLKSRMEHELASKAVAILEPLVGEGGVRANASVDMGFDRQEETLESYEPDGSVIRSQHREDQVEGGGDGSSPRGIPGTRSNPPADPTAPGNDNTATESGNVTITRRNETTNYEVTKRVRHVLTPTGRVLRRSVAVVVDDGAGGGGQPQPRSAEEVERFRQLVVAALGMDVANGDVATVESVSFEGLRDAPALPEPTALDKARPYLEPIARNMSWVLLLAVFYFVLFRPVMKKLTAEAGGRTATVLTDGGVSVSYGALPPGEQDRGVPALGEGASPLVRRAQQVTQQSPEVASELVRSWLNEG
jgi:flagellar M-ring protein FliF